MDNYDSDSSAGDDIETNVLLGYASKEPTSDDFSQLGGHPTWLDGKTAPSGELAKCKVCNGLMNLLLQINGDLPDRYPGHERRLYIWACRRKPCRRKEGSVRGFRATRQTGIEASVSKVAPKETVEQAASTPKPQVDLGESLFGVKRSGGGNANPFSTSTNGNGASNPFAGTSTLTAKPSQKPAEADTTLPETFAQKARISSPEPTTPSASSTKSSIPWPDHSTFPDPYPSYHLDADKEWIDPTPTTTVPPQTRLDVDSEGGSSSSSSTDVKEAFESSMDKTFQKFADRLAQNPEQVLRYEFAGQPLLYSDTDAVGKLLAPEQGDANVKVKVQGNGNKSFMPKCANCGAGRVFELQLTPHVIEELEADEMSIDGMDWGTIILGVCSKDCGEKGKGEGEVGYVEEWIGVQWEELAKQQRPA
ncbi:uncharacterized protein MYCGRDRAFT_77064 [Zymoseptoria tritici IPO323]|uniref:Programmed cell death protein 2 C-terminal domain-containing protein n=1 Tax=Zymoseptoria tritici (strain CBS 115943 / IPO323) TaxID=336722 RepID=F9XM44_ZYMTI|nr:uncharacterized protein MYCGRDRAFT_77064 [Zymoseptoria tritici IPO323]EGP83514.1 hypothetical protein MYCGRDRAFT_77064 [Zymoseptoria tritici IPO323]